MNHPSQVCSFTKVGGRPQGSEIFPPHEEQDLFNYLADSVYQPFTAPNRSVVHCSPLEGLVSSLLWSVVSDDTLSLSMLQLLIFDSPLLYTSCVPKRTQVCRGLLFTSHLYCISQRIPSSVRSSWHHYSLSATGAIFLNSKCFTVLAPIQIRG